MYNQKNRHIAPVDASGKNKTDTVVFDIHLTFYLVADFDNSPIRITIVPGDTDATVSIPITNDTILESDEKFNVVIDASGIGVALGYSKQTEVTIADEENSIHNVLHA